MDRKVADRIVVRSNKRMQLVLSWFARNQEMLRSHEFYAPLEVGVIEFCEEGLELTFESKREFVELAIFSIEKPNLPAIVTYNYEPETTKVSDFRFASHLTPEKKAILMRTILKDDTDRKEALKYHALMCFITYYKEEVKVTDKGARTKREAKSLRKDKKRPLPLIRKEYVIDEKLNSTVLNDSADPAQKRAYTKPEHEIRVRGHIRRYKSGKSVWIKPFVKNKDKEKNIKEYKL